MYGDIRTVSSRRSNQGSLAENQRTWSALDANALHPLCSNQDAAVQQTGDQSANNVQRIEEQIIIKDSCDIELHTTDTQAAVNLQAGLQVAIALVISITIGDTERANQVTQELLQRVTVSQTTRQQTYIENSRGVNITTTNTDLAVNIQLLLQVLVALLVKLDIL
ncbi:MAG TPA: spore coat protein [Bacillales bacterium]|nr:spore coat protein [Bacillales bacterium]